MVAVGLTDRVPDAATVPMPWLIEMLVAFVLDHVSVDAAPAVIEAGDALKVAVGGVAAGVTVTVAVAVTEPAAFVAVTV
jgi:hypothetical protein